MGKGGNGPIACKQERAGKGGREDLKGGILGGNWEVN